VAASKNQLIVLTRNNALAVPALIADAGERAARRFIQFFTANIRNRNTREAYSRDINAFLAWCADEARLALDLIEPVAVAAYVEKLLRDGLSKPTVKQHLAAIRMMLGSLTQRYVKRHSPIRKSTEIRRLCWLAPSHSGV
jgi:integrase/recombinase XerD